MAGLKTCSLLKADDPFLAGYTWHWEWENKIRIKQKSRFLSMKNT